MNGLTFGQPEFFPGLLLLIPLLALRLRAHFQSSKRLPGLVSPRLQDQLVTGSGTLLAWGVFLLQCLAVVSILAALARPQLGFDEIESQTEGRNLIVAIDTSRSMLAEDLRPNRLTRAKLAAKDIVLSLPEDRIGLLAFAGRPFIQAPLTVDHEAVNESIDQLDTEIIPRGGTNIAAAARLALETVTEAEVEQSALVIFSDGEALEGSDEVKVIREEAKKAGMTILSVGVGTSDGAIIPEIDDKGNPVPGRFVMDDNGQVVKSRLEPAALQELAALGGTYIHLGGQSSLTQVVTQLQEGIATSRDDSETRLRPIERFMWPLSAGFLFLIWSYLLPVFHRINKPATVSASMKPALIALALLPCQTSFSAEQLESGFEAFQSGDYESAMEFYEGALAEKVTSKDRTRLQMGVGATAYKLGDFERAATAYGEALTFNDPELQEQAHYNLGNTLFRRGEAALQAMSKPPNPDQLQSLSGADESLENTIQQWESAIEHFESSLALNAENARARHNVEVVKKKLEELREQQKEQEEQQKQEEEEQEKEEQKEEQEEEEEKKEEDQNEEEEKDESSEENQEEGEDGKPENGDEEGDQQEQPPGEEPEAPEDENEEKQEPENPEENSEDQDASDEEGGNEDKNKEESDEPSDSQNPEGGEPEEPDAPEDGELEADPNQAQPPSSPPNPNPVNPADVKTNPETGYSPSEARQLLDALADETEVRPILVPSRGEIYKNW